MAGNTEKSRIFTRRAILLGGAKAALFSLLAGRLYYLQVIEGSDYRKMAEENRINLRVIAPPRGRILDRFGVPLALNDQTFRVVLLPEQVAELKPLLEKLGAYISIDEMDRKRIERDMRERNGFNAIIVRDNLTRDQMDIVAVHTPELIGIDIDAGEVRSYPYGETTAHILGYVGIASKNELDNAEDGESDILAMPGFRVGKNGVEKRYEKEMRGRAGNVEMEVNAHGRVVRELMRHDPVPGQDLSLTIDIGLQQFAQQRLASEESASAVLMDIYTGEVLVLVSQPSFDPNLFTYGISREDWDALNKDIRTPLLNKAIGGVYAPGSTFKPITALAGLEAGIVDPKARVNCPGYYELGEHKFHCWKKGGHGSVNMVEAFAGSCDTYFYDLGKRVGIDRIQAMAKRFGLGSKLNIDLPHERSGFVPNRAWKKNNKHQEWQQGETLVAAIGQGFLLTSPLQLAVMAARIANNGFAVTPHVAQKIGDKVVASKEWASMGLDPANLEIVREGMNSVVNEQTGTAYAVRIEEEEMEMAGKTGSAQVRHISEAERLEGVRKNENLPWNERDHALFIGYAPVSAPRYAIAVVVEHGGSGAHDAAPIARDILKKCQERRNRENASAPST
ncbi:MAG: penicillin-binding protein 2 [Alphaproteobacteria bacterium]|nr:penicillin-binding protein 2 [Alphaproteobacteria bacterium]